MPTQAHVRKIAMALRGTEPEPGWFSFGVTAKGKFKRYVWVWRERVDPKRPKVPNPGVIAVRVANLGQKSALLAADPKKFFTEPHYEGFPAVLVRLDAVTVGDLRVLIEEAWRCQAPKRGSTPKASLRVRPVIASPAKALAKPKEEKRARKRT